MRAYSTIAFFALLTIACASGSALKMPSGAASTPNMSTSRYSSLMRLGSKQIDCPKQELVYRYEEDNRHALAGCGRSTEFILICLGTQCRWTLPPMAQASFDLNCAVKNLELVPIHNQKMGVKGCGRRASYGWVCQSLLSCDWYKDGIDGTNSEAAVAAAKAARQKAREASNQAKRLAAAEEMRRTQSSRQSTLNSAGAAAAAAANAGR